MDRRYDPRTIVTPYAFAVHPDLLGMPLAKPGQRLGAILVDLVVIFFLTQVGAAPLAIGSVALLFWLAFRKPSRDVRGKVFRITVGCLGFLILVITAGVIVWIRYGDAIVRAVEAPESSASVEATERPVREGPPGVDEGFGGFLNLIQGVGGALDLQGAETREDAQPLLNDFVETAYDSGLPRSEIRRLAAEIIPEDAPWSSESAEMVEAAIESLTGSAPGPATGARDAAAGEATGGRQQEMPGEELQEAFSEAASDSIDRLNRSLRLAQEDRADAEADLRRVREDLEAEQNKGVLSWLWNLVDDLGIGFGWGALYMTITHAWWKGTSIGKRFFRIRVVMIDKRPLNWWLSFERAGGYAAGFATGLLGFAQIFWDPNRQAIHDKVSETIVIQDGKEPVPGPWIDEGRAMWRGGIHGVSETH